MSNGFGSSTMPPGFGPNDELLARATAALNGNRPDEAERLAADLLKRKPDHSRAPHILGYALLMQGRARDAIAALEAVVRSRRDPELDTQLAIALRQTGRHDDAVARLKRATNRRPPFPGAFYELGRLLSSLERHDEAIEAFRRGIDVAPMMPELSIELGQVLLARKKPADARIAFARALSISPDAPEALFGMARACQDGGAHREAAAHFRRYLVARPDDRNAWSGLGHSLLEIGERDAGYDCFRTAARGDPQHAGRALSSLVKSAHGRFWLKPSAATQFLQGAKS
jgi:tetratricopeptide (TPR) repeat protein